MKYRHIILGGTGHIGMSLAQHLKHKGESFLIVDHKVVDIFDHQALHKVLQCGERLFILNPPAKPDSDTVVQETKSLASIIKSLEGLRLEKIVAASTYGAQAGDNIGDLGILYEMEQSLKAQQIPVAIIRSAYYMSNFDPVLKSVKENGVVPSLYPAEFELPMVAPADIGEFAAELMINEETGLFHVEGPDRYNFSDVAEAFSSVINKPVKLLVTPENQWENSLQKIGFSEKAAKSMANMTHATLYGPMEPVTNVHYGKTSLKSYIKQMVSKT